MFSIRGVKSQKVSGGGFVLPSVVIAGVILLALVAASLSISATTYNSLKSQYYNREARNAAEAGLVHAKDCISKTVDNRPSWSDPNKLYTGTSCLGAAAPCENDECYVTDDGKIKSYYSVRVRHTDNSAIKLMSEGVACVKRPDGSCGQSYIETRALDLAADKGSFSKLWSGWSRICAAAALDERVYCWGSNNNGELGDGAGGYGVRVTTPKSIDYSGIFSDKTIKHISLGGSHTCAIASDDKVYCWGAGPYGALGTGSPTAPWTFQGTPIPIDYSGVLSGKTVKYLSASKGFTCVIASDDKVYCWGNNIHGVVGDGTETHAFAPVAVDDSGVLSGKTIKQLVTGYFHACVLASDDKVYCWGHNSKGQLGDNSIAGWNREALVPVAVDHSGVLAGKTIKKISSKGYHVCAIASDDKLYCWGYNSDGQLGDGTTVDSNVPVAVDHSGALSGKTIKQLVTGPKHTCVLASDDKAYCWGDNDGALGDGGWDSSSVPIPIDDSGALSGKTIKQLGTLSSATCALASDNRIYCWGDNYSGHLGNGSTTTSYVPVAVDDSGIPSSEYYY
ncbi:hypothetical protein CR969_00700 [Candidatus Saccharibacteria bacterium]|nr:MAG: hypothetical protein CR969_00700 [Candidatus Saccharibacteria bacterium]